MSRGRPRHQSSRRRMYSPRQRDLNERRHQHLEAFLVADEVETDDLDESVEFETPSGWGIQLSARAGAA
jgi:hypothetical protein